MAIALNKLSSRFVSTVTKVGRHSDGGNLYLVVDKSASKRWVFFYRRDDRMHEMGLGGLNFVGLAAARELAAEARSLLAKGIDPIEARRAAVKTVPTFGECADDFIKAMKPQFRNAKHAAQWEMTLLIYAKPLRDRPVDQVTTVHVLEALAPIWHEKPETAARVRGRIERVLDAAKAKGYLTGENPALWLGNLANLLPKRSKLSRRPTSPYTVFGPHSATGAAKRASSRVRSRRPRWRTSSEMRRKGLIGAATHWRSAGS